MGGDLTLTSQPGKGTTFQFEIPVERVDVSDVQKARSRRRVVHVELGPGQEIPRLLIVEDNDANRKLLVKLLQPLNFEIHEARNGREALEVWEEWEPHLIWMDIRMPIMNGYEATQQIKATAKGQETTVVALTASAFEEERQMILSSGCDDFVRKPFREAEIFDTLSKHLDVRFVYEETTPERGHVEQQEAPDVPEKPPQDAISPDSLIALPADWKRDLRQATIDADFRLMLTLIEQIPELGNLEADTATTLTDALTNLVYSFDYGTIRKLIDQLED
jgi:CheY-like chemotaxis protein